uniref:Uncharacterized protein n=1 Tax=Falco tinnunculus TaxID=100819 RepID=A0A8C4VII1_FALTI
PAVPAAGPPRLGAPGTSATPAASRRLPLGLYLVVLPGARGWLAVAAHHIHHPQEQGVAAQPAQPQSHRGRGAESPPPAAAASPLHGSGGAGSTQLAQLGAAPLRGPAHTLGAERAAPRQRGPAGRLHCDTPGPGAHPLPPFLSPITERAGPWGAAFKPERGSRRRQLPAPAVRTLLPPRSGHRRRPPTGTPSAGLRRALSGHVLGAALPHALRVRRAPWAGAGDAAAAALREGRPVPVGARCASRAPGS